MWVFRSFTSRRHSLLKHRCSTDIYVFLLASGFRLELINALIRVQIGGGAGGILDVYTTEFRRPHPRRRRARRTRPGGLPLATPADSRFALAL